MTFVKYTHHGKNEVPCVLTIGNFDGVHLGHRSLLDVVRMHADNLKLSTTALTFNPTPSEYFAKKKALDTKTRILTTADKINMLQQAGINQVTVLEFNGLLQSMSAEDFFHQIIIKLCQAKAIVLGRDFRFGKDRRGDLQMLTTLGEKSQCRVFSMPLLTIDNKKVSSSDIRSHIVTNRIKQCNELLGYHYFIRGTVVHGNGRGKTIGFATANIEPEFPIPMRGVFVTKLQLPDGRCISGVTNIGIKPTFCGNKKSYETHLFDFDENIYDAQVKLIFYTTIRAEQTFSSVDKLVTQIEYDVNQAKQFFSQQQ